MKKLILFSAALLIAGQAGAYAKSIDNSAVHAGNYQRMISPGPTDRTAGFSLIAPSYGHGGYTTVRMDDPSAAGRTGT